MIAHSQKSTTLGILGGGQLGMLLAQAAQARNHSPLLYLPHPDPQPAQSFCRETHYGDGWRDLTALVSFAHRCDVLLLENEFIPVDLLKEVEARTSVRFVPELTAYGIFQNKEREKRFAEAQGLATGRWQKVAAITEVQALVKQWGRLVLKTTEGGYDGYGNLPVDTQTPDQLITDFLQRGTVLAEAHLDLAHELAVVVAKQGKMVTQFPIAETIQQNHICHFVLAPARLSPDVLQQVNQAAAKLVTELAGDGVFGIEFFITRSGDLFYNETAPRPHNSAHFTINACSLSQFDAIIDIALKNPLRVPALTVPAVGMLNLLGTHTGIPTLEPREAFEHPRGVLCLYPKTFSKPGRKMGHFNLLGENTQAVLQELQSLKGRYTI